jgi:NAD(P)-dependent dehydrogenase (short-subunit alcohol dehydrogenase family)
MAKRLTRDPAVLPERKPGGDSGIGRAVAIAFAREGADVLLSYLKEDDDARETARYVEEAGRKAILVPGDTAAETLFFT